MQNQAITNHNFNNKEFYKRFIKIAIPVSLQQLISMSLNFIDNIMVGKLGTVAIAAVGFANQIFFVYLLFLIGLYSGASTYIAQYFGKKDYTTLQKIFATFSTIVIISSVVFTIILIILATPIMQIFSTDEQVLKRGINYLIITTMFYPFFAVSFVISQTLRSIGLTAYALYLTIIVAVINTFLNYLLIYGNLGFPQLEVKGAAIATLIARLIEFAGFVIIFLVKDLAFKTKIKQCFGLSKEIFINIIKKTIPIFVQEITWVIGLTLLIIAYSKAGTDYIAIINISHIIIEIGVVIFIGISSATSVIIAQELGANNLYFAKRTAKEAFKISILIGIASCILGFIIIKPVLLLYNLPEYLVNTTIIVLCISSVVLFFELLNWLIVVGILRAGGDSLASLLIDLLPRFLYAVPMAFICILYLKLPIYLAVLLVSLEEVIKIIFAFYRYKSFKWVKNLTED